MSHSAQLQNHHFIFYNTIWDSYFRNFSLDFRKKSQFTIENGSFYMTHKQVILCPADSLHVAETDLLQVSKADS